MPFGPGIQHDSDGLLGRQEVVVLQGSPAGPGVDLGAYRNAVALLVEDVGTSPAGLDEEQVPIWLSLPEVSQLLCALRGGVEGTERNLIEELRVYQRYRDRSAHSPAAWLRIYLLSRIDSLWWNDAPGFQTDAEIMQSPELAEIHCLRRSGALHFSYHRLPRGLPGRARDWAYRRVAPKRRPRTAGLRLTRVRPEMLVGLNHLADEFQRVAPPGTPRLWVTSMLRSVQEQQHLRSLGYPAFNSSSHSSGYAFDVEVQWFEHFGADSTLKALLLGYQLAGAINAIDEGQVWHVCMSPDAVAQARRSNALAFEV